MSTNEPRVTLRIRPYGSPNEVIGSALRAEPGTWHIFHDLVSIEVTRIDLPPFEGGASLTDLELPQPNDSGAETLGGFLVALIDVGMQEKRPFGNSGWEYDLYEAMARAGLIAGTFDEDGYLETVDEEAGDALIAQAISEIEARYR